LLYFKKIRPEPFLLGSCIWLFLMAAVWFILPYTIYKKSNTFQDQFTIYMNDEAVRLEATRGYVNWQWNQFSTYFESDTFFHLYFNSRSFFLLPKEQMPDSIRHEIRGFLKKNIKKS
jgi:hypothetical protein